MLGSGPGITNTTITLCYWRVNQGLIGELLVRGTAPDGPVEHPTYRAWVVDVYALGETTYRTELRRSTRGLPGAIRRRQQVLGDLRHIRSNLGSQRRRKGTGGRKLRNTAVRIRHVLDLLNQMGWLTETPLDASDRQRRLKGVSRFAAHDGEREADRSRLVHDFLKRPQAGAVRGQVRLRLVPGRARQ